MGLSASEIETLVRTLKECGVKSFALEGLKIRFHTSQSEVIHSPVDNSPLKLGIKGIETEKIESAVVPQGMEEELNPDKILFWSTTTEDNSTPLTDDEPLNQMPIKLPGETTVQVEGKP